MRIVATLAAVASLGCALDKSGSGVDEGLRLDSGADTTIAPPTDTGAVDTSVVDTATDVVPTCKPPTGASLCSDVPPFSRTQVVDGVGDDFCDVEGVTWDNESGEYVTGGPIPDAGKVRVHMKVAWSSFGLHAFVDVEDPIVLVDDGPTTLWRGDSIEVYLSGFSTLTGTYDGTNDTGAEQIVISPPTPGSAAQSQIFLSTTPEGPLDVEKWAAITTKSGYAVELRIPWSDLQGIDIGSGSTIGFDVAVNSKWDSAIEHVYSVWKRGMVATSTCGGDASPACDDRTWCVPKLE